MLQYNINKGVIDMGREKFKIVTDMDSMYMHIYLHTHEQTIRNEFYELNDVSYDNYFDSLLNILIDIDMANEESYADSMYRSMQTNFLYLLAKERINKIRATIRAKRMFDRKSKKQLTIDIDVHAKLKKYARKNNHTLSGAIKYLLDNYHHVNL